MSEQRELIVRPEAEEELAESFDWYEQRVSGLGLDLVAKVEAGLQTIREHPLRYPEIYRDIRRHLIKRFPFGIYYLVEEGRIVVIAIFHASRDPRRWQERAE